MGITQQVGASSLIKPGVIDNTAARPASPYEGQMVYEKDTDKVLVWNGSAWLYSLTPQTLEPGAWQTWSPTVTPSTGVFYILTVNIARYTQIGKTVSGYIDFTLTSIGTGVGVPRFTIPVTASSTYFTPVGQYRELANTGNSGIIGFAGSTTMMDMRQYNNADHLSANNRYGGSFTYEAA